MINELLPHLRMRIESRKDFLCLREFVLEDGFTMFIDCWREGAIFCELDWFSEGELLECYFFGGVDMPHEFVHGFVWDGVFFSEFIGNSNWICVCEDGYDICVIGHDFDSQLTNHVYGILYIILTILLIIMNCAVHRNEYYTNFCTALTCL